MIFTLATERDAYTIVTNRLTNEGLIRFRGIPTRECMEAAEAEANTRGLKMQPAWTSFFIDLDTYLLLDEL